MIAMTTATVTAATVLIPGLHGLESTGKDHHNYVCLEADHAHECTMYMSQCEHMVCVYALRLGDLYAMIAIYNPSLLDLKMKVIAIQSSGYFQFGKAHTHMHMHMHCQFTCKSE